jgi:hypothetical protein
VLKRFLNTHPLVKRAAYAAVDAVFAGAERTRLNLRSRRTPFLGNPAHRVRFLELDPPHHVIAHPPTAWADGETDRYSKLWQRVARGYPLQSCGILEIPSARFHLPSGTVSAGGSFPSETISLIDFPFRWQYLDAIRALWAPARRVEDGYLLTLQQSANYYHFVCEVLPLAYALMRDERWGDLPVYVGADLPEFVFEYLRLLGLERYCRPLRRGVYAADTLRVASFPGMASCPSPDHLLTLRGACLDAVGPSVQPGRRLYISRADAPDRRIANEGELLRAIADFGFERATLSDKSVPEQIRLFQTAEIVLAPHGAGNSNILFAPSDCVVTEIMGPSIYSWSFMVIASTLGQLYGYVGCVERGRDLVVDPSAVRRVVESLLRARDDARSDRLVAE